MANNFPTIKPSLNLQFSNTGTLPPDVTFTRASQSGGYYDGVTVSKAEENLLLRSQDYSATWTVTDLTPVTAKTAPNGTSTATEFTAGGANAVLTQGYTAIAGSYTFSVFLRRVTGSGDIEIAADNGTFTVKVITGTWARYDVTQTVAAGSKVAGVRVVTSGDVIEVWGAQLEQRASVTAYNVTTTAPITNYIPKLLFAPAGVPVFDHNPTTGEALGLSVWEARTNLLQRSQEFDDAYWTKGNVTVSANQIIAPDGTLTADKLVENTVSGSHTAARIITTTAGVAYTLSIYLKRAGNNWALITSNLANTGVYFDLLNGVTGTIGSANTATINNVGDDWFRVSITFTETSTGSRTFFIYTTTANNVFSHLGDGVSGSYLWGAQLEAGQFSTPYTPTVGSTVARSADVAVMTGVNFSRWFNAGAGTLVLDATPNGLSAGAGVSINNATTNNRIRLALTSVSDQATITTGGTAQAVLDGGTPAAGTAAKFALSYKVNDFALSLNGGAVATDTVGTIPVVTQMQIGAETTTVGSVYIRSLAYYPIDLSDANIVAVTA